LTFPVRQVILGQFIGIGLLVGLSALGSFMSLVIPIYIIGLLGIVPIVIGVQKILSLRLKRKTYSRQIVEDRRNNNLAFAEVAGVTFSNGGDNIGVYTPIFAQYNHPIEISLFIIIFMIMTAVWCIVAYYLVNHPLIASKIRYTGHIILPFVLIGIGVYIILDSFVFSSLL
jgi:cadmium resistance protein CadD (predicted permease)